MRVGGSTTNGSGNINVIPEGSKFGLDIIDVAPIVTWTAEVTHFASSLFWF